MATALQELLGGFSYYLGQDLERSEALEKLDEVGCFFSKDPTRFLPSRSSNHAAQRRRSGAEYSD